MMTRERFAETGWKMTYEQYQNGWRRILVCITIK